MQVRNRFLALSLLPSFFLTSCGGNFSLTAPPGAALEGNWHLSGAHGPTFIGSAQSPFLSLVLGVNGGSVYGTGQAFVPCSNQSNFSLGSSFPVSGIVAADGTLALSSGLPTSSAFLVTIAGKAPADGTTTWDGSFTLANSATETTCVFNLSGEFTAVQYAPFTGTYSGKTTVQGADVTVVARVQQGASPSASPNLPTLLGSYHFPVTSTISMTGWPCYTSGVTSSDQSSGIQGDVARLNYVMNDGSTMGFTAWYMDDGGSTVQAAFLPGLNSTCSGGLGPLTLTRQP